MKAAHIVAAVVLATTAISGFPSLQAQSALPRDVHPDTRNRLPPLKPDEVNAQMRKAYDAAVASSPGGRPEGASAIRLHRSGVDVRWDAGIGRRLSELAILTIAREYDQPYEWSLHEMEALSVGLEPAIADVVRHRRPATGLGDKEAAIIQLGREIGRHKVSSETYARALKLFGKTDMVDMVDLMSNYAGTGVNLTAANQWMPPQMKQFLPLPFTMPDDILPDSRSRIPVVNPARPAQANAGGEGANAGLYRRTLAPAPTGPGSMAKIRGRPEVARSEPGQGVDCAGRLDHGAAPRSAVRLDDDRARGPQGRPVRGDDRRRPQQHAGDEPVRQGGGPHPVRPRAPRSSQRHGRDLRASQGDLWPAGPLGLRRQRHSAPHA